MRNPWIAIMVAAANGRGLNLSADEVRWLSRDGAIETCAQNDIDRAGDEPPNQTGWRKVDPTKYGINPTLVNS
jgi:hypothetical protein